MARRTTTRTTSTTKRTLGRDMLTLYDEMTDLIDTTADAERRAELRVQQDALWDQIARLVETNLDAGDQRYRDAVAGLQDAITQTRAAIKGLESIVSVVQIAARTVALLAKVLPVG